MLCFAKCILYFAQKFRTLLFLCELPHRQRNNISGLVARYKIFGVNDHKGIILSRMLRHCRF